MSESDDAVGAIFDGALQRPPGQRAAYVRDACAGDRVLQQRVEALLLALESAGAFMTGPAVAPPPGSAPAADVEPGNPRSAPGEPMAQEPDDEAVGQTVGRYQLLEKIGEGGCGVVYLAEQKEPIRRHVALKVIKLGMDTRQVILRFEAERQALALMDHPNIAKVLDGGASETGRPYFVMELVRGIPITQYCDQTHLTTHRRLDLFIQVCQAIQHAHQKGIIHRDIKPSNILVTQHDGVPVPKVIDFGIAKAIEGRLTDGTVYTQLHQFIGTPAYMSPEQADMTGLDIDTRSDIYSLGVLLYELLAGSTPFDAQELMGAGLEAMRRIIREREPRRPSTRLVSLPAADSTTTAQRRSTDSSRLAHQLQGDLDWIVMKCLEKDRSRRYETANGLAADLRRHLANEPVVARPPTRFYRLQKAYRRNRLLCTMGSLVVLALVLGLGSTSVFLVREKSAQSGLRGALARMEMERSEALFAAQEPSAGLAYLVRAARREGRSSTIASRVHSALTYHQYGIRLTAPLAHRDEVESAEFSPDGRRVVTASKDHSARIWDAGTGQPVTEPLPHGDAVASAHFSPDGRRMLTASKDGTARVWDTQTGQLVTRLIQHPAPVHSARFSADGLRLVTASEDRTAVVWDAQTGEAVTAPLSHQGAVLDAEFSLDGSRVVTASADHTAQIWDVATSQPVLPPFQHGDRIVCARFSPDGQRVATASWDKTARVWDLTKDKDLGIRLLHLDPLTSIEFSPDGQRVLSAAGNRAQVWDVRSGGLLGDGVQHLGVIQSAQFSPDGQRFVTTSTDHVARVWDALMEYQVNHQTGRPLHNPIALPLTEPFRHAGPIRCARFSPDGQRVVTASSDHTAQIWDARTGGPLVELLQQYQTIWSAEFSPDGRRIATASQDGNVRVWDVKTGQPLTARIKHNTSRDRYGVRFAEFGPDGTKLVTAFRNKAQILDSQTGDLLTGPFQHTGPIVAGHFSPDGQRLVTASADQTAQVWDAATAQPVGAPLRHAAAVNSSEFSSDGRWVVTASDDHTARVWDAWSGRALTDPLAHRNKVLFAQFSPDRRRVVTASQDQTARLWDAATGKPLAQPLQHQAAVRSVRFSPDGQRVVTASEDMTAVIWNAHTGQTLAAPLRHRAPVLYAEFSPDGSRVVTASLDSTIRVWEAASGLPLTEPLPQRAGAIRARFSPDGQRVLTAAGRTAQVWETPVVPTLLPAWVLSLAEAVADRELDEDDVPRPVPSSRLLELRRQAEGSTAGDFWTHWARWFFADATTRTLSPSSAITVPDYVHRLIEDDTLARLREAVMLEPENGLALAGLGLHVFLQTPDAFPRHAEEAAWYSRRAVHFAPHQGAPWRLRGRIQTAAGNKAEALLGLDRALELDPRSWYTWQLKAALLVEGQRFEEAIKCYDRQLPLVLSFTNSLGVFDPVEEGEVRLKRAGLLRKLGRNREAEADIRLACGIIERSPQATARLVDLSLFYNGGLRGYWVAPDPQSGLDALPQGIQTLGGVAFDVRGVIQTASSRMHWQPQFPPEVTAIPVNTKASRLHFLHAGAEGAGQAGTTIARYVFHYADGQTRERPIQLEDDVLDWWEVPAGKAAQHVAWSGENEGSRSVGKRIHLYVTTWENPRPDVEIAHFDIVSERTSVGLFLVAVTSE